MFFVAVCQRLSHHPAAAIVIFLLEVSGVNVILVPATKFIYELEDWLKVATSLQFA